MQPLVCKMLCCFSQDTPRAIPINHLPFPIQVLDFSFWLIQLSADTPKNLDRYYLRWQD